MRVRALIFLGAAIAACSGAYAQTVNGFVHEDGPTGTPCDSVDGLPCNRIPPHLADLPDPTRWNVVRIGGKEVKFRRATQNEQRKNGWARGTYLVDAQDAFRSAQGAREVSLFVPTSDDRVQEVPFVLKASVKDLEFVERTASFGLTKSGVRSRVVRPVLHEYVNQGFDSRRPGPTKGAWATMIGGDNGGFFATGIAGGFEFEAGGPGRWAVDAIESPDAPPPLGPQIVPVRLMDLGQHGGTQLNACAGNFASPGCNWLCAEIPGVPCTNNPHLGPPPTAHCVDGINNDGDGGTDAGDQECQSQPSFGDNLHPGTPRRNWESGKSFVLFGEGRFCTRYAENAQGGGNWIQRLTAMGWKSEALINAAIGFQGVTGREMQVRYRGGACWVFPSPEAAAACNANGSQCLPEYPYADSGASAANYYNRVWNDVHHATYHGLKDALHFAQAVHWGGSDVPLSCSNGEAVCCGASLDPAVGYAGAGSSVVQYEYTAGAAACSIASSGLTGAHEIGHGAGIANHNNLTSFMKSPAANGSMLPDMDKNLLVGCMAGWNCPRPSGFRYIP